MAEDRVLDSRIDPFVFKDYSKPMPGIIVYTVAFQVSDRDTLSLLKNCATEADMAFQSSSTSALLAAFNAIGDDISSLRVSK